MQVVFTCQSMKKQLIEVILFSVFTVLLFRLDRKGMNLLQIDDRGLLQG